MRTRLCVVCRDVMIRKIKPNSSKIMFRDKELPNNRVTCSKECSRILGRVRLHLESLWRARNGHKIKR